MASWTSRPRLSPLVVLSATFLCASACGDDRGSDTNNDEFGDADESSSGTTAGSEAGSSESETADGSGESGTMDGTADETADTTAGETADTTADTTTDEESADETMGSETMGSETMGSETTDEDETAEDSSDDNMACQEFVGDAAPLPPDVLFLLDRSGSMLETGFDPMDPAKTRWQALYEAVEAVVDGGADQQIAFGAKTFSTKGQGSCGVSNNPDVPIALNNAGTLLATIPGPFEQVNGGTPTNLALDNTMGYMESYETDSDKFVILITDGRIGCAVSDDAAIADAVATITGGLDDHAITTYVVGIAPSQFGPIIDQLNAMAIAGGAPSGQFGQEYYLADDSDMLAAALEQVVEDSYGKSCLINLEEAPFFPDYTQVVVNGVSYELVDDCDSEDGLVYTNPENTQIKLCGQACEDFGDVQEAQVEFYCNPN